MRINLLVKQNQYYKARKLAAIFCFLEYSGVTLVSRKIYFSKKMAELANEAEGPESLSRLLAYIKKSIELRIEGYK